MFHCLWLLFVCFSFHFFVWYFLRRKPKVPKGAKAAEGEEGGEPSDNFDGDASLDGGKKPKGPKKPKKYVTLMSLVLVNVFVFRIFVTQSLIAVNII